MVEKKRASGINDHIRKKGVLLTPINEALGANLELSSWAKDRMPEYLWIGLILLKYERIKGLEIAGKILFEISKNIEGLSKPSFSQILQLSNQEKVYEIICKNVEKDALSPLTIICRGKNYRKFNNFFLIPDQTLKERFESLSKAVDIYSPHQSNEATDLRFLIVSYFIYTGKVRFVKGVEDTISALKNYPITDHKDEKMRVYRPQIRSFEGSLGGLIFNKDKSFSRNFWKELCNISNCKPMVILHTNNFKVDNDFLDDCRKAIEFIFYSNKETYCCDEKMSVLLGITNYSIKIYSEILSKSLGDTILGRQGLRIIIESYIMMKYLIKSELDHPDVWQDYKKYGLSKFKLILLKARDYSFSDINSHLSIPLIDGLVNEFMYEEFMNVDLNYFDKLGIREKSNYVDEKQLYDLFYDYDTTYTHALWGAIRESSMLFCNNPTHQFHSIPDFDGKQLLPDVRPDCYKVVQKIFLFLSDIYDVPESFAKKYF